MSGAEGAFGCVILRKVLPESFTGKFYLFFGVKFVTIFRMRKIRPISWIKAARRDFEDFPADVQSDVLDALSLVAEGLMPTHAKPLKGFDGGLFEIALRHRGDAFRAVYALRIDTDIWVIHAFQKKSRTGIKTPQMEIDLIVERLKRLKEMLR